MGGTSSISFKTNSFKVYIALFIRLHSGLFAWTLITWSPMVLQWHLYFIEVLGSVVVGDTTLANNTEGGRMDCQVIPSWVYSVCVRWCVTRSRSFSVLLSIVWRLFKVLLINVEVVLVWDGGRKGSWALTCLVAALHWGLLLSKFCMFCSAKRTCSDRCGLDAKYSKGMWLQFQWQTLPFCQDGLLHLGTYLSNTTHRFCARLSHTLHGQVCHKSYIYMLYMDIYI